MVTKYSFKVQIPALVHTAEQSMRRGGITYTQVFQQQFHLQYVPRVCSGYVHTLKNEKHLSPLWCICINTHNNTLSLTLFSHCSSSQGDVHVEAEALDADVAVVTPVFFPFLPFSPLLLCACFEGFGAGFKRYGGLPHSKSQIFISLDLSKNR